jgi:hypothetical protein
MVEFKLQLDEAFVQTLGYNQIENYLKEYLQKLQLKASANDILANLDEFDLVNDEQWKLSRSIAWEQEKNKFLAQ